ncbi:transposase [Mycobacterium intracellulare]|nr:transposase [Mycobacterium intracellulare]
MARKNYSEEFRRDAVELYRVTEGATVAQIAADLGIAHGSLSAWLRAAGVAIRRRGHTAAPPGPPETAEQEATRLRAGPRAGSRIGEAEHRTRHPAGGGQIFRRGDELVSRFQFVADHSDTFEVKWLCQIVEVARSSFYAWVNAAEIRTARTAADDELAQRIRAVHSTDTTTVRRGSPPSSTTAPPMRNG